MLRKDDEFLMLTDAIDGNFDMPGGRIDEVEHETPLPEILGREIVEELGKDLRYKLGRVAFQYRRHFKRSGVRVFVAVYEADYVSGEIVLSPEHTAYKWLSLKDYEPQENTFCQKEEYLALKAYLAELKN